MLLITDLPPEIRNIIYEIVVADDRPILVRRRHCLELGQSGRCALTQASHQIRVESLPIYYSTNIFELAAIRDFKRWLSVVGDSCQYLRRLQFMDGMIEGLSWKMTSPTPRINLITFSMRLSSIDDRTYFSTGEEVKDEMEEIAFNAVKESRRIMAQFGPYDVVVTGKISHCWHCAKGACHFCMKQRCCFRK